MRHRELGFSHILILFLLVVALGAIGFTGLRVYQLQQPTRNASASSNNKGTSNSACTPTTASAKTREASITKAVCNALAATYDVQPADNPSVSTSKSLSVSFKNTYPVGSKQGSIVWRFPDDSYGVEHQLSDTDSTLLISYLFSSHSPQDVAARKAFVSVIDKSLIANGLKAQPAPVFNVGVKNAYDYYADSSSLCSLTNIIDIYSSDPGFHLFCAPLSSFTAMSAALKPINAVVAPGVTAYGDPLIYSGVTIENSKTSGYKIAYITLSQPDLLGALYQKQGVWHVVYTDFNHGFSCDLSSYPNQSDVRLAFLGQECDVLGTDKPGTVE